MSGSRRRLAERRKAVGLSQESLAENVGVDRATVVRWEHAQTEPQPWNRPRLARALKVSVEELAALLADVGEPPAAFELVQAVETAVSSDLMRRRTLIAFGAAASPGVLLPGLALEAARHGLVLNALDKHATVSIDEWREIIDDHGHSYLTTQASNLLGQLAVDVVILRQAIADHQDDHPVRNELLRIGAALGTLTALTLGNLGQFLAARRWWRSARQIAHRSGDVQTVVWVRGHEVVRSLYEGRSPAEALRLAEEGEAYAVHATPVARPRLIAGKAQALAMLGRASEAEMTLNKLRDTFAALPSDATGDDKPLVNTPESRLRHTESFVYAYLGDTNKTEQAQRQALALYPPSYPHGSAQVELLKAFCLVRAGDVLGGVRYAQETMSRLTDAERIRPVVGLGYKILEVVPKAEQRTAAVADFRAYLATPNQG